MRKIEFKIVDEDLRIVVDDVDSDILLSTILTIAQMKSAYTFDLNKEILVGLDYVLKHHDLMFTEEEIEFITFHVRKVVRI